METESHQHYTPSGYPERQQHRLASREDSVQPDGGGVFAIEGAAMAEAVAPELTDRERKLAEIAARVAIVLDREHELEVEYLVSASRSDQIRRSA
jgi:hypothetical protein